MGIFDKLAGTGEVQLTPKSALALAALTVIGVDGVVEDEEREGLRRIVRGDDDAFSQAYKVYKVKSVAECIPLVSNVLDGRQKAATITNLLDIAMADGVLASAEETLLDAYLAQFDIAEDVVKTIINVIAMKNNFSVFE